MSEEEQDLVKITADPLLQNEITEFVTDPSAGAISLFLGMLGITVRRGFFRA